MSSPSMSSASCQDSDDLFMEDENDDRFANEGDKTPKPKWVERPWARFATNYI